MKANEAPKKIYVTECILFMTNPEITLQGNGNKIEYTRTDAFIEKACDFISSLRRLDDDVIEDFRKYMKGE